MSAHNVFLHYLAETGILGAGTLMALAIGGIKGVIPAVRRTMDNMSNQTSVALFIAMFVFMATIFYTRDWTWGQGGYILSFLFGTTGAWLYQLKYGKQER